MIYNDCKLKRPMNLKAVLLSTLLLLPTSALAQQRVYNESYCYENVEEYIPGYYDNNGEYVRGYLNTGRRRVPCGHTSYEYYQPNQNKYQSKKCVTGGLGAILGGIASYKTTPRVADRWYMIPLGIFGGNAVGNALCE